MVYILDWKEELKNLIKTPEQLKKYMSLSSKEIKNINEVIKTFKMSITPYYASLMDRDDKNCPIRRIAMPNIKEINQFICTPKTEEENRIQPLVGIRRRYPDRCLLIPTLICPNYCRFCFRKYWVGRVQKTLSRSELSKAINFIKSDSNLREVIITGGEPFVLSDGYLDYILKELKKITHIKNIRIGTRAPVFLPSRFTDDLINILKNNAPIYIITHFNHPKEITEQSIKVCSKLSNNGILLFNQTVLLRGINDKSQILKELFLKLVEMRVKPYYLFHCINTMGNNHFVTKIDVGTDIIKQLYCNISGLAIPIYSKATYHGKLMLMPKYIKKRKNNDLIFENYEGYEFSIKENT